MKTALITTTINVPAVLALYRRFDPSASVRFFVAIDEKTPMAAIHLCDSLGNVEVTHRTNYKCDPLIGDNSIQRRNIALLEALKWGADIIVSVDDDNIPLDPNYFYQFEHVLAQPFSGLKTDLKPGEWFDVGAFLQPPATHRGIPAQFYDVPDRFTHVIDAKIGVAAGMVLGDPDTSAVERIARSPRVSGVAEILKAGIVVDPHTHTVFNSQNTAIIRELAPAMMMSPGVGRYDDIFAGLLCQRVMRDRGLHVHFGRPFVYQQRNQHDLTKDLKAELFGMEHLVQFAEWLDAIDLNPTVPGKWGEVRTPVLQDVATIFAHLAHEDWMPKIVSECGLAWCDDCEAVL